MAEPPRLLAVLAALAHAGFTIWWTYRALKPGTGNSTPAFAPALGRSGRSGHDALHAVTSVRRKLLGAQGTAAALAEHGTRRPDARGMDLGPIDARVAVIRQLIRRYSGADRAFNRDPRGAAIVTYWKELAVSIVSERCGDKWCVPEKNWEAEATALFNWTRKNFRYVRDPRDVDVFSAPDRTLATRGGDCDDASILLGTLCKCLGMDVRLRVIQTKDADTWSHIYLLVDPSGGDGVAARTKAKWVALDASMDKPAGWEAPGASQVAASSKPSGIVVRVKDYSV